MSFQRTIKNWNKSTLDRVSKIYRQSAHDVYNRMTLTTSDGGRVRRDTGFLVNSAGAELNEMPSGPTENETGGNVSKQLTGISIVEAIARWKPGDWIGMGFTANYARYREHEDGFVRGAAEKWPAIVRANSRKVAK